MIIVAGQMPRVSAALNPIFGPILPHTPLQAALSFGLPGGICSIYRGPLVVIGTGAAVPALVLANKDLPILYLYSVRLTRPSCRAASIRPISRRCGPSAARRLRMASS